MFHVDQFRVFQLLQYPGREKLTNVAVTVFGPSDLHGTICQ